jgi:drug/metabolite transporter (DMT)-like permease
VDTPRRSWLPWLALLVVYVVWGSTYLAIRVLVREAPPLAAAGLRFFVAGCVMSVLAWRFRGDNPLPTRAQLGHYAAIGVLLLSIGNGLVMWAEKTVPSGITALIVATVPLWLTLLDGLRASGQPWTVRAWLGAVVGLVGVMLVARPEATGAGPQWAGVLGLQAAALSWTIGSLYAQALPRKLPLLAASAVEMLAGALVLLLLSLGAGESWSRMTTLSPRAWGALLYLIVLGSIVGFTAFAYCLEQLPASTVGTYAYVNPAVAVLLGALLLREPLSTGLVAGGVLILVSVLVTTLRAPRHRPPQTVAAGKTSVAAAD